MQAQMKLKKRTSEWFVALQSQIIHELELIEKEMGGCAHFKKTEWKRHDTTQENNDGGGGTTAVMRGNVFEKAGVNVSTVYGQFHKDFASRIPGCDSDPFFLGIWHIACYSPQKSSCAYCTYEYAYDINTKHMVWRWRRFNARLSNSKRYR